jgi:N-acetylated-alpha-linked acidic dipeptidase
MRIKRLVMFPALTAAGLMLLAAPGALSYGDDQDIRGFFPGHVAAERAIEQKLLQIPDAAHAEANLRRITSEPHMAGTEASHRMAEWLRDQYQSFGFDAAIESYSVWLPAPGERLLELETTGPSGPQTQALATPEQPFELDKYTYDSRAVPAFNAYSASGDVTAQVVYVNYGMSDDYSRLDKIGISVAGKVVLARYGQGFRGVKAQLAQEHGASGLLIYSDPADDGYFAGDADPRGPWRPWSGIQRGSILYTSIYPGDPLTPGVGATPEAKRLPVNDAKNLPRIPVLPINALDAQAIFSHMGGMVVPQGWQGAIPLTYHLGPGEATVHLKLVMNYQERTIYDVIARLPGSDDNSWVIFGNHHDAWVFGAVDPGSGTASMLEAARALGQLSRAGWKPKRTIVFCEWDGEEFGLIGSTEWVETHAAELQKKALAYVNTDVGVAGPDFGASAVPSFKEMIRDATSSVSDPRAGRSIYQVWQERVAQEVDHPTGVARQTPKLLEGETVNIGALGAGSDFCPFLDHVGIPSLDMGFNGPYGVYHSLYDDFYWMQHFGDPTFAYHAAMARILGVMALRMSNADVIPFNYPAYAAAISRAIANLQTHEKEMGGAPGTKSPNEKSSDQGKIDLQPVMDASLQFTAAAARAQQALRRLEVGDNGATGTSGAPSGTVTSNSANAAAAPTPSGSAARVSLAELNHALAAVEQAFLLPQGLPGRPWYRHEIYAPGSYTGYASVVLPGVTEALERKDFAAAQEGATELATALRRAATQLDDVTRLASPDR